MLCAKEEDKSGRINQVGSDREGCFRVGSLGREDKRELNENV